MEHPNKGISAIILIIAAFIFIAAFVPKSEHATKEYRVDENISAFVMSQEFVKRVLKAPSTASFPHIYDEGVTVEDRYGVYVVSAFVDSQNSFSAMIRNSCTCQLKKNGDKWELVGLIIDGKSFM